MTRVSRKAVASQRGFGLVEMSLVLIIVAIALAVGYQAYQSNTRSVELQSNTGAVTQTAAELQKKFGKTNKYGDATTAVAVRSRAIPQELRVGTGDTAQNSYGGNITVAPANCSGTNDCVDLTWSNVPEAQCIDLVISTEQVARSVVVGGAAVKPLDGGLDVASLSNQCNSGAVSVVYRIGRG